MPSMAEVVAALSHVWLRDPRRGRPIGEVQTDDEGKRVLRWSHCPLGQLVNVTKAPCRAELSFVRDLLGQRLSRVSYIPTGDSACCYTLVEGGTS